MVGLAVTAQRQQTNSIKSVRQPDAEPIRKLTLRTVMTERGDGPERFRLQDGEAAMSVHF